jgi:hypothetical protein
MKGEFCLKNQVKVKPFCILKRANMKSLTKKDGSS